MGRTQPVTAHLVRKYTTHFNFFLTREPNQIVYNNTTSPATITFKDAVIFADHNEYLKRIYFLKNSLDKDEIYDRIRLLSGNPLTHSDFYSQNILLRYEYPLMVLTRTKSIFLKRLKRMKKVQNEEGSSDESHSER